MPSLAKHLITLINSMMDINNDRDSHLISRKQFMKESRNTDESDASQTDIESDNTTQNTYVEKENHGNSIFEFFLTLVPSSGLYRRIAKTKEVFCDNSVKEVSHIVPLTRRYDPSDEIIDDYCNHFYEKAVIMMALVKNVSIEEANKLLVREFESDNSDVFLPWITRKSDNMSYYLPSDDSFRDPSHLPDDRSEEVIDEDLFFFEL